MPKHKKKSKQKEAEEATAQAADDFDDMLAEMCAADLSAPTASSSSSTSANFSTTVAATATVTTLTNVASPASSTPKAIEVPEDTILKAIRRGNIAQLRSWGRQGLRVSSIQPLALAAALDKLDASAVLGQGYRC